MDGKPGCSATTVEHAYYVTYQNRRPDYLKGMERGELDQGGRALRRRQAGSLTIWTATRGAPFATPETMLYGGGGGRDVWFVASSAGNGSIASS